MLAELFPKPELGLAEWAVGAFQIILLCADGFALWWLKRNPTWRSLGALAVMWMPVLGFLSLTLGLSNLFFMMRLVCYGLFLHLPLMLLLGSLLTWKPRRSMACFTLVSALVLIAVAIDAFFIEPEWLAVTHRTIASERMTESVRIAIVADLQTDYFGDYQRDALRRCLDAKPDLILLAGDYVQIHDLDGWEPLRKEINEYLHTINFSAPMGVYAVHGNTDHAEWQSLFDGLAITCLPQTKVVDLGSLDLTGLGIMDSFGWNLQLARPTEGKFHLALGHAPDFARSEAVDADLLIAGHTHGGQVRLPWIGPLMTASSVPRSWAIGVTELSGGRKLLVSRGIGMERGYAPRLRFLCRPELVILDLVPAK